MTKKKVSQMGKYERDMITQIMGLLPKMEFATHRRSKSDGVMVDVYDHSGGTILDWIQMDRMEPNTDDDDDATMPM